jgi:hypothetical protein
VEFVLEWEAGGGFSWKYRGKDNYFFLREFGIVKQWWREGGFSWKYRGKDVHGNAISLCENLVVKQW